MAVRFYDTSALTKHYRVETGTAKVDGFLAEVGSRHLISGLSVVEFHSVLARLVRTGAISASDFHFARGRFLADISCGLWQVVPVLSPYFQHAEQLLVSHGLGHNLRTLDALQLAAALASSSTPLDAFVSADANLCAIAVAEGPVVVNPEIP